MDGDGGFGAVVDALLRAHAPEDDGPALVEALRHHAPKETYVFRGTLLASHMRQLKRTKRASSGPIPPETAKQRIDRYHREFAVRPEDRLDVRRVQGKGNYKKWLPSAMLRACWGLRPKTYKPPKKQRPRKRQRRKAPVPTNVVAPTVDSCRCFARFYRAGHGHVQRLRNACAQLYIDVQKARLEELPHHKWGVLELAIDETEFKMSLETRGETAHVMVTHCRFRGRRLGSNSTLDTDLDIVIPPTVVPTTSASALLASLNRVLPFTLDDLRGKCARSFAIVLNSDAGSGCLKLVPPQDSQEDFSLQFLLPTVVHFRPKRLNPSNRTHPPRSQTLRHTTISPKKQQEL